MKLKNSIIAEKSVITLPSGVDVLQNKLRIAVFGDNEWCLNLLRKISKDKSLDLIFICGRYKKDNNLIKFARSIKVKFIKPKNINSNKMIKFLKK